MFSFQTPAINTYCAADLFNKTKAYVEKVIVLWKSLADVEWNGFGLHRVLRARVIAKNLQGFLN